MQVQDLRPNTWLIGQDEGPSNLAGKTAPTRFWDQNAPDPAGDAKPSAES